MRCGPHLAECTCTMSTPLAKLKVPCARFLGRRKRMAGRINGNSFHDGAHVRVRSLIKLRLQLGTCMGENYPWCRNR